MALDGARWRWMALDGARWHLFSQLFGFFFLFFGMSRANFAQTSIGQLCASLRKLKVSLREI
jgi:hypothetical protein